MKADPSPVVVSAARLRIAHRVARATRRLLPLLALVALVWSCNLVGYDAQRDPSTADDGGALTGTDLQPGETRLADGAVVRSDGGAPLDGGDSSRLDASLRAPLDSGWDGGPLEAGWWDARVPDQTCVQGERCYPTCEPALGMCVFDCASSPSCQNTCLPGTACEVSCEQTAHCFTACKEDGQCWQDCQHASDCEGWCTKNAHCQIDCAHSQTCHAMCLDGSSCEIDCRGGADCSGITCSIDAKCLVYCAASGCDFDCAGGAGTSCPGNIRVCNRPCP